MDGRERRKGLTERRARIAELHRRGLSNPEIARKVGCSRVTSWRTLKAMGLLSSSRPAPRAPAAAPRTVTDGPMPDAAALRQEAVAVLRESALAGSTNAAIQLVKLMDSELDRTQCVDHVPLTEVATAVKNVHEVISRHVLGVCRAAVHADVSGLEDSLHSALDDASTEIIALNESERLGFPSRRG